MSILTDLLHGKITFSTAVTEAESWAEKLVASDPTLASATNVLLSDTKQAASDAITIGESALGPIVAVAANSVAIALEGALGAATKGLSTPFNPLISAGIDTIANAVKSEVDAWALKAKADLTQPVANAVG